MTSPFTKTPWRGTLCHSAWTSIGCSVWAASRSAAGRGASRLDKALVPGITGNLMPGCRDRGRARCAASVPGLEALAHRSGHPQVLDRRRGQRRRPLGLRMPRVEGRPVPTELRRRLARVLLRLQSRGRRLCRDCGPLSSHRGGRLEDLRRLSVLGDETPARLDRGLTADHSGSSSADRSHRRAGCGATLWPRADHAIDALGCFDDASINRVVRLGHRAPLHDQEPVMRLEQCVSGRNYQPSGPAGRLA